MSWIVTIPFVINKELSMCQNPMIKHKQFPNPTSLGLSPGTTIGINFVSVTVLWRDRNHTVYFNSESLLIKIYQLLIPTEIK